MRNVGLVVLTVVVTVGCHHVVPAEKAAPTSVHCVSPKRESIEETVTLRGRLERLKIVQQPGGAGSDRGRRIRHRVGPERVEVGQALCRVSPTCAQPAQIARRDQRVDDIDRCEVGTRGEDLGDRGVIRERRATGRSERLRDERVHVRWIPDHAGEFSPCNRIERVDPQREPGARDACLEGAE